MPIPSNLRAFGYIKAELEPLMEAIARHIQEKREAANGAYPVSRPVSRTDVIAWALHEAAKAHAITIVKPKPKKARKPCPPP